MSFLIDSNVLLRTAQPTHSMYQVATDALVALRSRGEQVVLVAQNLYRFKTDASGSFARFEQLGQSWVKRVQVPGGGSTARSSGLPRVICSGWPICARSQASSR